MTPARRRRPAPGRLNLVLPAILLLAANAAVGRARGQSAPGTDAPVTDAPVGYPDPRSAGLTAAVPECGFVTVTSGRCDFKRLNSGKDRMQLRKPMANIIDVLTAGVTSVPFAYNGLRQVLKNTFAADPAKPDAYAEPPLVTVSVKPAAGGPAVSVTRSLASNMQKSVQADSKADKNKFQLKRERGGGNFAGLPLGKCEVVIRGPCTCPAPPPPPPPPPAACTFSDTACAVGATCPGGTAVSAECADRSAFTESPCACTALEQLAALSGANLESPWNDLANAAYCTLADDYYYPYDLDYYDDDLDVRCTTVDGVKLPDLVTSSNGFSDFTAAMVATLGDLGPAMKRLSLYDTPQSESTDRISELPTELGTLTGLEMLALFNNAITSVPTELGALTGLTELDLRENAIASVPTELGSLTGLTLMNFQNNQISELPTELGALTGLEVLFLENNELTGVPVEFWNVDPSIACGLSDNDPSFSCANVGFGTRCCSADNCGDTSTCYTPTCSYTDTTCAAGSTCPGGTAVSAECADRSGFDENPCACTALQQLAALSTANLATGAPWNDLANAAYCTVAEGDNYSYDGDYDDMDLDVRCTLVDGVNVPDLVNSGFFKQDLTGALPAGLGDLGPALKSLRLGGNQISEVPTELGALTGLTYLDLSNNAITALPTEIGTLTGLTKLELGGNALTSVPTELGALTDLSFLDLSNNRLRGVPTEFRTVDPDVCLLSNQFVPGGFNCANVRFTDFQNSCCDFSACRNSPEPCYVPPPACAYADTACAVGATCPGGTAVSAECADRSAFSENPCACTALQELAALSPALQAEAPWNALADNTYCTKGYVGTFIYDYEAVGSLQVLCETSVDGVDLPVYVYAYDSGLAGALPDSFGELGALTEAFLRRNAITSLPSEIGALTGLVALSLFDNQISELPTEIGALTGLTALVLSDNQLTGVPTEFRLLFNTFNPSAECFLQNNAPSFSCANVGSDTFCCDPDNCPAGTSTCYQG